MSPPRLQTRSNFPLHWPDFGIYADIMARSNTIFGAFMPIILVGMAAILRRLTACPPRDLARRTLDYMGRTEAVLTRAEADFTAGDYRWVVYIVDQIIWAEPDNMRARQLAAAAHTQMGYGAENPTCCNAYLSAANEL